MTANSASTDALLCNQCGAQLRIEEDTRFVICSFCGCQLKVRRSGGGIFSEIIEEIQQRQEQTDSRVRILELENNLLRLDQQWDQEKEQYLIHPDKGRPYLPDEKSGVAGNVIGAIIGVIALVMIMGVASQVGGGAVLFALPVLGIIVFSFINSNSKRDQYLKAKKDYQFKRSLLTTKLEKLRSK